MKTTKEEILREFDLAYYLSPGKAFPITSNDIKHNFLFDLESGYTAVAGSKIHVYSKGENWVVVAEVTGFNVKNYNYVVELFYYGNAFKLSALEFNFQRYLSNVHIIELTNNPNLSVNEDSSSFGRFRKGAFKLKIRDTVINIQNIATDLENAKIKVDDFDNPENLISKREMFRYLYIVENQLVSATENEIARFFTDPVDKILTIDEYHYTSHFVDIPPSEQELFNLIADVIVYKSASKWKPKLKSNSNWRNWESGTL